MALYPIKQLQDQNRSPFFPFNTLESVLVNGTDKNLADVLADIYTKEEINTMFSTELSKFSVYESISDLPETARDGAVAAVDNSNVYTLYIYYESAWHALTQKGDTGPQGPAGATGPQGNPGVPGPAGQDGFSPIANVSKTGHTATISITDSNGTTTADVYDGENLGIHIHFLKDYPNRVGYDPETDPDNLAVAQDIYNDVCAEYPFIAILQIDDGLFIRNTILNPSPDNSEGRAVFTGSYKTELGYASGYDMDSSKYSEFHYVIAMTASSLSEVDQLTFNKSNTTHHILETNIDYDGEYTPQYDGSPATKKYVDDHCHDNSYALGETQIGTWFGEPLYRGCFSITPTDYNNLPNATTAPFKLFNITTIYGAETLDITRAAIYIDINGHQSLREMHDININAVADFDFGCKEIQSTGLYYAWIYIDPNLMQNFNPQHGDRIYLIFEYTEN